MPEGGAVRSGALMHDDIRTCIAQRARPPRGIREEEWLLCVGDKLCSGKRPPHSAMRLVTGTGSQPGEYTCIRSASCGPQAKVDMTSRCRGFFGDASRCIPRKHQSDPGDPTSQSHVAPLLCTGQSHRRTNSACPTYSQVNFA